MFSCTRLLTIVFVSIIMKNYSHTVTLENGKTAFAPSELCRSQAELISHEILRLWRVPKICAHLHYQGGHVRAIKRHTGNHFFSVFDIQNFFPSINRNHVIRSLCSIGIAPCRAREIATISCVKIGENIPFLPFGFPQSSLIATLVLFKSSIGKCLLRLSKNTIITIYADDIIVSAKKEDELTDAQDSILAAFKRSPFIVNEDKSQFCKNKVTIFNLTIQHCHLSVESDRMQLFEAKLNDPSCTPQQRNGIKSYLLKINDPAAAKLLI